MGRGNVCVFGDYEGLFYVDYDKLEEYYFDDGSDDFDIETAEYRTREQLDYGELTGGDWKYDEIISEMNLEDFKCNFESAIVTRFKSFSPCDEWIGRYQHAILENDLFYIAYEDNEWSVAVELLQKEDPYGDSLVGLQKKHYQTYLNGMRDALFKMFDEIGIYGGAWTSGSIKKEDFVH